MPFLLSEHNVRYFELDMSNDSDGRDHYLGERLSLKGHILTIRWIGQVADKPGIWLGVEWDEPDRGKHNGTHEGVIYFRCK